MTRPGITRRELGRIPGTILTGLTCLRLTGWNLRAADAASPDSTPKRPDSFRVYTDAPRLLLRPQRLRLLKRERERMSLRWEQLDRLWSSGAEFPELPMVQALRWQIAGERESGIRAVAWAVGPGDDIRQIALVTDWCDELISRDDRTQIETKLRRAMNDTHPVMTLSDARARLFAAVVLTASRQAESEKAIQSLFDGFWMAGLITPLRTGKTSVASADAFALLEFLHVFRDNLGFDLRETFPAWFAQYPLLHLASNYPAPFPAAENEFRIPADRTVEKSGPDVGKAVLSRAAELAMVALDSNAASSQLLQGWLINDRFLMRGALGIPYEFLWANPYQPGLSYYHAPLAVHDAIGGQLFVRSSWEDDAAWVGFFGGELQRFAEGAVISVDPLKPNEPLDLDEAVIIFGRENPKFLTPAFKTDADAADAKDAGGAKDANRDQSDADDGRSVFIVGLTAGRSYHVEVDGEEMVEERADPGGILALDQVPGATGVRLNPRAV